MKIRSHVLSVDIGKFKYCPGEVSKSPVRWISGMAHLVILFSEFIENNTCFWIKKRRLDQTVTLQSEVDQLESVKSQLKQELEALQSERDKLRGILDLHECSVEAKKPKLESSWRLKSIFLLFLYRAAYFMLKDITINDLQRLFSPGLLKKMQVQVNFLSGSSLCCQHRLI